MLEFGTKAAHPIHPELIERPSVPPLYQTSVFVQAGLDEAALAFATPGHQVYTRMTNPNAEAFAAEVARLEEAPSGAVFSSGMAALFAALLTAAGSERCIYAPEEVYGGTYVLLSEWLPRLGFDVHWISVREPLPSGRGALLLESLTNPLARPIPLSARIAEAKAAGMTVVVDNTFATPYGCRPYPLGADLVVHSATKALSGHAQVILGVAVGDEDLVEATGTVSAALGLTPDPFACWLASAGLRTLALRQERQVATAGRIAAFLATRPEVAEVFYAGLPESPDRELLVDYVTPGSLLGFRLKGGREAARRFLSSLSLITFAPSLGDVTTTVLHPEETSHRALPVQLRQRLGIGPDLIRLSAGIEDVGDLLADLARALEVASG